MSRSFNLFAVIIFSVCLLSGCGNDQMAPASIATSQLSYDEALVAFDEGNFEQAESGLTNAISNGGLDADLIADALLKRAIARRELGRLDEALADVEQAAPGAGDLSVVHQIRGDIKLAQNDIAAAREEYTEARKLNPQIPWPAALK